MSALHVVIQPRSAATPNPSLTPLLGLFDVVVDGVNITARTGEADSVTLLTELGQAVRNLASGTRTRQSLPLYSGRESWEIGLEADGAHVLLSVFRSHPSPRVAVSERRVETSELTQAVCAALTELERSLAPSPSLRSKLRAGVELTRRSLETQRPKPLSALARVRDHVAPVGTARLRFSASADFRVGRADPQDAKGRVERADLHGLLLRGSWSIELASRELTFENSELFLDTERLLELAAELCDSLEARRPIYRRPVFTAAGFSVRYSPDTDQLELRVKTAPLPPGRERTLFCEMNAPEFCRTAAEFARELTKKIAAHDTDQERNLRLRAVWQRAESLLERLDDAEDETLTNPHPASYRCFAPPRGGRRKGVWDDGGKIRFAPRWVATVPQIDLNATFLCGDRLVVGSQRETACIDRLSGSVLWRQRTGPARSVVSPSGLLRIEANGHLSCHSLEDGERRFELDLNPRPGLGITGSVVDTVGLPKLLAVTEGDRQVTAIDLITGDVRWRYTSKRPAAFRLRRAGRLMLVAGGDPTLTALDVATGEVVWRLRQPLPFSGDLALDRDSLFALTGANGGQWSLLHLDAWTGRVQFAVPLEERPVAGRPPLISPEVIAVPIRDDAGSGLSAYDRETGSPLWEHAPGLVSPTAAWLTIDDTIVANSAGGVLVSVDAKTGAPRYNHVFSRSREAEAPRRLEPILRSGALFVPQERVHVVRPRDGEIIGTLPSDLIPDLIRVDERCDVYVAEDSGHLAAFTAGTRLTLVK